MNDPATLASDISLEQFRLSTPRRVVNLLGVVTSDGQNDVETTIEGASTLTLTVHDQGGDLRKTLSRPPIKLAALEMHWELAGINKDGDRLTLTFEDRLVAELRRQRRPDKATRGKVTRARFIRSRVISTVRRCGGRFVCPELDIPQPIAKTKRARGGKDARRNKGFASGTKIKGKEGPIVITNAEIALDVAAELSAGPKATLAMVLAFIVEGPDFKNPAGGDGTSSGSLQVTRETARALGINPRDVEQVARAFLKRGFTGRAGAVKLAKDNPSWSAGQVAQAVQGSAHPHRYGQYSAQGKRIIAAYGGGKGSTSRRKFKKFEFSQGPPGGKRGENAWDMAARLADEVGWRRFAINTRDLYLIAEQDLMRARPRMRLQEGSGGVDRITYDGRPGASIDQASVQARAKLWSAPPGSVVTIAGEGEADGRWLVSSVRRPLFSLDSTIDLRRNRQLVKELAEPAPEERSTGSGSSRDSSGEMERPVVGGTVPSGGEFGARREAGRKHGGIDIAVPVGTTVKAALGGTVSVVSRATTGYGLHIDVRHAHGLSTRYAHLSSIAVKQGQRVSRGQKIAESGNTGSSTGPHLHFEVHKNGVAKDPRSYL